MERFHIQYTKKVVITFLLVLSIGVALSQNATEPVRNIEFSVSFANDTLNLIGDRDNILNIKIKNNSDSIFIFYPNGRYILTQYREKIKYFTTTFTLFINWTLPQKSQEKEKILISSGDSIDYKLQFNINDSNIDYMAEETINQSYNSFSLNYNPYIKKGEKFKRLYYKGFNAFVEKKYRRNNK